MQILKIAVGTTSEQKIKYLKEVLKELKIKSEVIAISAKSGVAEQPKTSEETEQGAINRAMGAFNKEEKADFSIGIEVGYHKNKTGEYEMFCWVAIINKQGFQLSSQSHKFLLPKYHQNLLNKDIFMGDNLDGYLREKNGKEKEQIYVKKHIDEIIRYRKPFVESALKTALIRCLKKEDF